tara:strand:- start:26531 stop:26929 length:399 start_codon:yes stop_codon:yes gene_type:complete
MSYGTDIGRKIGEQFKYFVRGRQLMIIEMKLDNEVEHGNEPNYTAPKKTITNGLLLEYTAIPDTSEILNETDVIPLNDTLALALVDYCKAALIDKPENMQKREYLMARFKDRVAKYVRVRVGGIRQVVQRNF